MIARKNSWRDVLVMLLVVSPLMAYNVGTYVQGVVWTDANDGVGSGLDADLLAGSQSSAYVPTYGEVYTDNASGIFKDIDNVGDCTDDLDMARIPLSTSGLLGVLTAVPLPSVDGGASGYAGLAIKNGGTFRLTAVVAMDAVQPTPTMYLKLCKAGAELSNCEAQHTFSTGVSQANVTLACLASFATNQLLDIAVCSSTATDDYDVSHAELSAVRVIP